MEVSPPRVTPSRHSLCQAGVPPLFQIVFVKIEINNKILDENAIHESLIAFKRAGANAVVTYFAEEVANEL